MVHGCCSGIGICYSHSPSRAVCRNIALAVSLANMVVILPFLMELELAYWLRGACGMEALSCIAMGSPYRATWKVPRFEKLDDRRHKGTSLVFVVFMSRMISHTTIETFRLPPPAALAAHGIRQMQLAQQRLADCTWSRPHGFLPTFLRLLMVLFLSAEILGQHIPFVLSTCTQTAIPDPGSCERLSG